MALLNNYILSANIWYVVVFVIGLIISIIGAIISIKARKPYVLLIGLFLLFASVLSALFTYLNYLLIEAIFYGCISSIVLLIFGYFGVINLFNEQIDISEELVVGQEGVVKTVDIWDTYATGKMRLNLKQGYITLNYEYDLADFESLEKNASVVITSLGEDNLVYVTKIATSTPKVRKSIF